MKNEEKCKFGEILSKKQKRYKLNERKGAKQRPKNAHEYAYRDAIEGMQDDRNTILSRNGTIIFGKMDGEDQDTISGNERRWAGGMSK